MPRLCPYCEAPTDNDNMCFYCGRGLTGLTQGAVVGSRYEILKPLGQGGMGIVYEARDHVLDEIVALKLMRTDVDEAAQLTHRFRSEIKLARRVTHPNVCRIHDYGEEGRFRYISMELVRGTDFKEILLRSGALSTEEAYEAAIQLASALQAIHKVGIIHRDLKTPNVMRDAEGSVRLMDFGIAKHVEAVTAGGVTATGQIVGSPEYMSPEQARGDKVDQRSDIYSLGIVIFEMFSGDVPFRGDTPVATLFMHIQAAPLESPAAARLPPPLRPILARALAKEPHERFASAEEMAEALREARALTPPGPAPGVPSRTTMGTAGQPEGSYGPEEDEAPTVMVPHLRRRRGAVTQGTLLVPAAAAAEPAAPAEAPVASLATPGLESPSAGLESASAGLESASAPTPGSPAPTLWRGRILAPRKGRWEDAALLAGVAATAVAVVSGILIGRDREDPALVPPPTQAAAPAAPPAPILAAPRLPRTAEKTSAGSTRLSWQPVAGATSYRVMIAERRDFRSPMSLDRNTVQAPSFVLQGLGPGTYYWRVAAVDQAGRVGPFSAPASLTIDRPPDGN